MQEEDVVEMRWRCSDGMCAVENLGLSKTCRRCGRNKPVGPNVDYFSDGDGSTLPQIIAATDLDKATACGAPPGERADRICYRCGHAQWRSLATCDNCGAPMPESRQEVPHTPRTAVEVAFDPPAPPPRRRDPLPRARRSVLDSASDVAMTTQRRVVWALVAIACLLFVGMIGYAGCRTTDTDVTVTSVAWIHCQRAERLLDERKEGFDPPGDASGVVDVGMRHHHYEDVFDHWKRVDLSHWDKVPDGEDEYRCTTKVPGPKPPCYRGKCVPQGNGTASCPKICPDAPMMDDPNGKCKRTKYKRTWVEDIRREPVTRQESRQAMWHAWTEHRWVRAPELDVSESGLTLRTQEPRPQAGLGPASVRYMPVERSYDVGLTDARGHVTVIHPGTLADFLKFPRESRHVLRTSLLGGVQVDPPVSRR